MPDGIGAAPGARRETGSGGGDSSKQPSMARAPIAAEPACYMDRRMPHPDTPTHNTDPAYSHRRAKRRAIRKRIMPDPISTATCGARRQTGSSRQKTLT